MLPDKDEMASGYRHYLTPENARREPERRKERYSRHHVHKKRGKNFVYNNIMYSIRPTLYGRIHLAMVQITQFQNHN